MRSAKPGDSKCGYDRDVHHSASIRLAPIGPLADAHRSFDLRLSLLQVEQAKNGSSLILHDPRDLAGTVERLAKAGQLEGLLGTWEQIGAFALAGWVAALRAQEARVDTGAPDAA